MARGQAYQDLFVAVMTLKDPRFRPIRPHGNIGDRRVPRCQQQQKRRAALSDSPSAINQNILKQVLLLHRPGKWRLPA
jgi:hypothetical protein